MKYVEVRCNGGPIQGFGRHWPVIIGAMCLWLSHKSLLGEKNDMSVSQSASQERKHDTAVLCEGGAIQKFWCCAGQHHQYINVCISLASFHYQTVLICPLMFQPSCFL